MSTKMLETLIGMTGCSGTESCIHCAASRELDALSRSALDLREVAFDGPSQVKGAPGGESYTDWRSRIDRGARWLSSVPGMKEGNT